MTMNNKNGASVMGKAKTERPPVARTLKWQESFEKIIVNIISVLVFVAFGFVAIMSIFQTSVIDPEKYVNEHILFQPDNLLINLPLTALFFMAVMAMANKYDFFKKVNMTFMEMGLAAFVMFIGLVWVLKVQSVPAADSANIFYSATGAVKNDFTNLRSNAQFYNHAYYQDNSYFMFYPFQLGFVFICELIYRLFGTESALPLEIINVICVTAAYLGIAKISKQLFKRRSVEFITVLLLMGCLQPVLFTTFAYGNIMGMAFAVWACYFLIRYLQGEKWTLLIPSGVLLVLSTLAKYNNMIYLVAFVIVLILHAIRQKKWQSLAFILAICICTVGASKLIIMSYENRSGQKYTSGVSQTLYLDIGLQESYMAPGWYTNIGMKTFMESGFDSDKANAKAKQDIDTRVKAFTSNLNYGADFFSKKILSQWNEPSYESIWVSKVKSHYNGDPDSVVKSVYDGGMGKVLDFYFNIYMQALFLLFAGGMLVLLAKGRMNSAKVLLPLVLLGAFGYHLLFEGKSQYILTYIILMIPTAAWAAVTLIESKINLLSKNKEENHDEE